MATSCSHPSGKLAKPALPKTEIAGWEGFFPLSAVSDSWLTAKGIPLHAETVRSVAPRVAKLNVAHGPRRSSRERLDQMRRRYCDNGPVLAWNKKRCEALKRRTCVGDTCTYEHFGSCSGVLLKGGVFLTAAHCVAGMHGKPNLVAASEILMPGTDGLPARRLALGRIRLGKLDFDHDWVSEARDPVDVATVAVDAAGLSTTPLAPGSKAGDVVFIVGYPRAERRSKADRAKHGYPLVFGTPSASFGRMVEPNAQDRPFCSVDGQQEHWAIDGDCPRTRRKTSSGYVGVITQGAFTTTADSVNGYSGAPVFDAQGRLIGINTTCAGGINPQEGYRPFSRAVGVAARRALQRLGVESAATCVERHGVRKVGNTRLDIVRNCKRTGAMDVGCEIATVVRHPSAPFAAVFCHVRMRAGDSDQSEMEIDGRTVDCSKVPQYSLRALLVDLETGRKRSLRNTLGFNGTCFEPRPDVNRFRQVWSPKGEHVAISMGIQDSFWCASVQEMKRWIAGGKYVRGRVRALTADEDHRLRTGKPFPQQMPEAHRIPFHEFEGWITESAFAFRAACCDTVDFFSYDIATGKQRSWGTCGDRNTTKCMATKRKEMGVGSSNSNPGRAP